MKFFLRLALNALGVLGVSYLIPGFNVSSFVAAFLFAIVFGVINALVRPLLILLTLPLNILTLGIATLFINALLFWLASTISFGVTIGDFAAAFWGGLLVWIIGSITGWIFKDRFEEEE